MTEEQYRQEIIRLHERIDHVADTSEQNNKGIAVILERLENHGRPGHSDACHVHRRDLREFSEALQGINKRVGLLETNKVRTAGFLAGIAALASLLGSFVTLGASLLYKLILHK